MSKNNDINEDEIRVIGNSHRGGDKKPPYVVIACSAAAILLIIVLLIVFGHNRNGKGTPTPPPEDNEVETQDPSVQGQWMRNDDSRLPAATLRSDTTIDGIRLMVLRPMNAVPKLCIGPIDENDNSIILASMAADIRRDNGKIVGAFVCEGEPKAWGLSKKGYCAIINGNMAIGVAENSPYFEQATETQGYFFRQYPAVSQGKPQANNPENKSIRRAVCSYKGDIAIIVSLDRELMNDFSNALAKMGVENAVFLIGGSAHGWYIDSEGNKVPLSDESPWNNPNINYLYFQKK